GGPMTSDVSIAVPAATATPLVTAFGLALVFAGLVTHVAVSAVGVVLLACGAIGWWRQVMPVERHEQITASVIDAVPSVYASRKVVEHLSVGTAGHRVRIPAEIHPYSAGLAGGAVGAVAMAVTAIAYGVIGQHSVWYVINLLAAGVVPSLAAADLQQLRG